ncbi:MAG TPA: NERD domain-containing protein kinase family protein [Longimicrobium sp.]|jgi:hypothetical protein
MAARVIAIGDPRNDAERLAIAHLRDHLPDSCTVMHSVWLRHSRQSWEIDLIVLTPQSVWLVDVKNVHRHIDVYGTRWHPSGRQAYKSPIDKLEMHARELREKLEHWDPRLSRVYMRSAVLLTARDVSFRDHMGRDEKHVTKLQDSIPFLMDGGEVPEWAAGRIGHLHERIIETIRGRAAPRPMVRRFREWEEVESLGGDEEGNEYRARHPLSDELVRVREYRANPYLSEAEQDKQNRLIQTAFVALSKLSHPNVLGVRTFFENEDGDAWVLVTDEPAGESLRVRLTDREHDLSTAERLQVVRDVLTALDHAHSRGVVHRQVNADAVLVGERTLLAGFDHARVRRVDGGTIASLIVDRMHGPYVAPECEGAPDRATAASDVFSAGLLFFELLAGGRAFDSAGQMRRASAVFPHPPSVLRPALPRAIDGWLQALCAWEAAARPTAAEALGHLDAILSDAAGRGTPAPEARSSHPGSLR